MNYSLVSRRSVLLLFVVAVLALGATITQAGQATIIVVPKSFKASESGDGFTFKATDGEVYYVMLNPDFRTPGANLLEDDGKTRYCITFDEDKVVQSIHRGECRH